MNSQPDERRSRRHHLLLDLSGEGTGWNRGTGTRMGGVRAIGEEKESTRIAASTKGAMPRSVRVQTKNVALTGFEVNPVCHRKLQPRLVRTEIFTKFSTEFRPGHEDLPGDGREDGLTWSLLITAGSNKKNQNGSRIKFKAGVALPVRRLRSMMRGKVLGDVILHMEWMPTGNHRVMQRQMSPAGWSAMELNPGEGR